MPPAKPPMAKPLTTSPRTTLLPPVMGEADGLSCPPTRR
jgi:hypothetical protein